MAKDKNKKTTCTKKKYRYTALEVAEMAECSESYVKKIRSAKVSLTPSKAQKVLAIDTVLHDSSNALLDEISRIVKV